MSKTILITGANGILGSNLIKELLEKDDYKILALDLNKDKLSTKFANYNNVFIIDESDLEHNNHKIDIIVNCGFARSKLGHALISSINFAEKIFKFANIFQIPKIINISSQSVYGSYRETYSKETDTLDPIDNYAIAKFTCEKLSTFYSTPLTQITNVRLASLIGPDFDERIVTKLLNNAIRDNLISLVGGTQRFSFLDIRDAVSGLIALIENSSKNWKNIYNLGTKENYTIIDLANYIANFVNKTHEGNVTISLSKSEILQSILLDNSLFCNDFNWQPKFTIADSIRNIYESKYC